MGDNRAWRYRDSVYTDWLRPLSTLQQLSSLAIGGHISSIDGMSRLAALKEVVLELRCSVQQVNIAVLAALPRVEKLTEPFFDDPPPWITRLQAARLRAALSYADPLSSGGASWVFPLQARYIDMTQEEEDGHW